MNRASPPDRRGPGPELQPLGQPLAQTDIAELQEVIGHLYKQVDAFQIAFEQSADKTHDKLDEWIGTNHQLLAVFQQILNAIAQHSEQTQLALNSSAKQTQLLDGLSNQLPRSQQIVERLEANQQVLEALAMNSEQIAIGYEQHNRQLHDLTKLLRRSPPSSPKPQPSQSNQTTSEQIAQLQHDLSTAMKEAIKSLDPRPIAALEPGGGEAAIELPFSARERSSFWEAPWRLLVGLVAIVGGLGVGAGVLLAKVTMPQPDPLGPYHLTKDQVELLKWAQTQEGQMAQDLMRWNPDVPQLCAEAIDRLGGKCVLWVVPPRQRPNYPE